MLFKFIEIHDTETDTNIIVKVSPKKELEFYINAEDIEKGKQIMDKIKPFIDEMVECEKRTTIENFIVVPM